VVELFLRKSAPALHKSLGIFLPLITTNCAVLGVALTNVTNDYSFFESVLAGFGTALGYTVAIVLLAGIRETVDQNENIPEPFKGAPTVLLIAALMAIAFAGFANLSV
jgi:electron transport complex protein RnfA